MLGEPLEGTQKKKKTEAQRNSVSVQFMGCVSFSINVGQFGFYVLVGTHLHVRSVKPPFDLFACSLITLFVLDCLSCLCLSETLKMPWVTETNAPLPFDLQMLSY